MILNKENFPYLTVFLHRNPKQPVIEYRSGNAIFELRDWTDYDYFTLTRGWLSCFREENNKKWIKEGHPLINMTESEFANYETHKPDPSVKKEYDFIYVCLKDGDRKPEDKDCPDGWQSTVREFKKAKKLMDIMCKKYKMHGLLIGRIGCVPPPNCHQLMELTDFMEYNTFIKQFNRCKFILTASYADASPRTATEAMCFMLTVSRMNGSINYPFFLQWA